MQACYAPGETLPRSVLCERVWGCEVVSDAAIDRAVCNLRKALGDDARLMHPMPIRRNLEVSDAVLDGPRSLIYEQAENRLHAQKALLLLQLIGGELTGMKPPFPDQELR